MCLGAGASFLLLTVIVESGFLRFVDDPVRDWGVATDLPAAAPITDFLIEYLGTRYVLSALLVAAAGISVRCRSARPVLFTAGAELVAVGLVLSLKVVLGRPDPTGPVQGLAGSYPSGHTFTLIFSLGLLVLLLAPCPERRRWWVPGLAGLAMSACLVMGVAHWVTDIVAGWLLAAALLAGISASGLPRWVSGAGTTSPREVKTAGHRSRRTAGRRAVRRGCPAAVRRGSRAG